MPTDLGPRSLDPAVRADAEALLGALFALQTDTSVVHVWRGQADTAWRLLPTLYRRLLRRYSADEITEDLVSRYETDLFCESNGLGFYQGDRLTTMVALQHHGGATRFLDVTRNVLISLWFATEPGHGDADGAVYHFGVPARRVFQYDRLRNFDDIVNDQHEGRPLVFFPRPDEERIKAQQAGFLTTVLAEPISATEPFSPDVDGLEVESVRVPFRLKAHLRRYLERSAGLNTIGIYPDFAGYAMANGVSAPFAREPDELHHGRDGLFPNRV